MTMTRIGQYRTALFLLTLTLFLAGVGYYLKRHEVARLERRDRENARIIKEQQAEISALRKERDAERATPERVLAYDDCFTTTDTTERRYLPPGVALLNEGIKNNPELFDMYKEKGWLYGDKIKDYRRSAAAYEDAHSNRQ